MFRILPHTADVGLEVQGETLEELFLSAAEGWKILVLGDSPITPQTTKHLTLQSPDLDDLLVQWLSELNYLLQVKQFVTHSVQHITIRQENNSWTCEAIIAGEKLNPAHHDIHFEIKAVTYHQLHIQRKNNHFHTRIIFDI